MSENTEKLETPQHDTFVIGTGTPLPYSDDDEASNTVKYLLDVDEKDDEVPIELTEAQKEFNREACSLLSTVDPETGLEYAWLDIRKRLCDGEPPVEVLPAIFEYYEEKNNKCDSWINYQLACSHFQPDEIGGPKNRFERKKLEAKIKKLMKLRLKKPAQAMNQFLAENANVSI